jgi:hypothetical protein
MAAMRQTRCCVRVFAKKVGFSKRMNAGSYELPQLAQRDIRRLSIASDRGQLRWQVADWTSKGATSG